MRKRGDPDGEGDREDTDGAAQRFYVGTGEVRRNEGCAEKLDVEWKDEGEVDRTERRWEE